MQTNSLIKSEKVRDLKTDEPIRAVLRYVVTLTGVNMEKHDKLVFDVIISTIKRSFKGLEVEEIKEAFDLCINGQLDLLDKDIHHYQKFSSIYVSTVLKSYKRYKIKNRKIKEIETKPVPALTFDEMRHHSEIAEAKFKLGHELKNARWVELFQYYVKCDRISIVDLENKKFAETVKQDLIQERTDLRANGKPTIVHDMNIESEMFFRCEVFKRAVIEYYETLND